ncbi:MAG: hypothetical protein JKY54_04855, partial [Flavobacteriales bacterium]|nr:hypothetical protein [Flavobacteriales bacterium]
MAELEIHHINVGQGDSTLIIVRDLVKLGLAIDAAIEIKASLGPKPVKPEDLLPYSISKNKATLFGPKPIKLEGTVKAAMLIDAGEFVYGQDVAYYLESYGVSGSVTQKKFVTVATHFHSDHVYGFRDVFFKNFDDKKKMSTQTLNYPPKIAYDCGDLHRWDKLTYTIYQAYIKELVLRG